MSQYVVHFTSSTTPGGKPYFTVQPYKVNGPAGADPTEITGEQNLDLTTDTPKTSLLIYGQDMPNYGEHIQENLLHLLESFWNTVPPNFPTGGQLWFDAQDNVLRVYHEDLITPANNKWVTANVVYASATSPSLVDPDRSVVEGNLWFDTTTSTLKIYDGSNWIDAAGADLPLAGGTMDLNANITMNGGEVLGLPNAPTVTDAATSKYYVDNQITTNLASHSGSTALHITTGQNNWLDQVVPGGIGSELASATELSYLSGASSNVQTQLNTVSSQVSTNTSNLSTHIADDTVHLTSSQNTWIDTITATSTEINYLIGVTSNVQTQLDSKLSSNPPASSVTFVPNINISSTDVQSAIQETYNEKLSISGGTLTGSLVLNADPTNSLEAATKQYVDSGDQVLRDAQAAPAITGWVVSDIVTLPFNYDIGSHRLWVFVQGIKWLLGDGYTETAVNQITWQDSIPAGTKVEFLVVGKNQ